ncbi:MAG TPA: hypothetical protein PLS49_02345 [Candidatus Woesebacteria bacterium]|nr:hypothetical protein [Candidatus Woesebacteria bacterium]
MQQRNRPWFKTWWGILLLLGFLPFTLTYLIWNKKDWSIVQKRNYTIGLWGMILIGGFIHGIFFRINESKFEQQVSDVQNITTQITPTTLLSNTPQPTKIVDPTPVYDESLGNNYVAAKYAEDLFTLLDGAAPGYIDGIFVETSPESTVGKSDEEFIQSVRSVFVKISVDRYFWETTTESSKKDLMTAWLTHAKGKFPKGLPHIYVDNGIRRVSEAEYSFMGEPKIELE